MVQVLEDKVAVVYGAGGPMGGAIARGLAGAGASLFLAGHAPDKLETVAESIRQAREAAEAAELDVDDRDAVERHADGVVGQAGRIDVSCSAVGTDTVQNRPMVDLSGSLLTLCGWWRRLDTLREEADRPRQESGHIPSGDGPSCPFLSAAG